MFRPRLGMSLALAILAVASLTGRVVADEKVPFWGGWQGQVTITPLIGDPTFDVHVEIKGAGKGLHLGKFSVSVPHDVDRRSPPNPSFAVGEYVFTAANGDVVRATFTGQAVPYVLGVLYIVESATITGGTGRFEGATGNFECERLFDTVAGTTIASFKGTISSPGASKR